MKRILMLIFCFGWASAGVIQSEMLNQLHTMMNVEELGTIFGVNHSSSVEEYEVIYIRQHRPSAGKRDGLQQDGRIHYSFSANGKEYNLKVRPNNFLIAPKMKTVVKGGPTGHEVIQDHPPAVECHFLHVSDDLVAAISHCSDDDIHGYLIDGGRPAEIRPLTPRLRNLLHPKPEVEEGIVVIGAHILRLVDPALAAFKAHASCGAELPVPNMPSKLNAKPPVVEKRSKGDKKKPTGLDVKPKSIARQSANKILELGIFVDEAALALFMPYLGKGDYVKLRELVLVFVNGMQALYHLPSLGQNLDLSIVYMEFQAKQPAGLPAFNGERGQLLDSFCSYQTKLNKKSDSDPEHWDMALYLSGLDFYAVENGKNSYVTMGLSTVTGVCTDIYNCVIGEFGVVNQQGQPYPSTGFTSIFVMAHEIGHNLGMSHDSSGNTCPTEGFIMSPSRGVVGETIWSTCSAKVLAGLRETCMNDVPTGNFPDYNHKKFEDKPGKMWSADDQCRILLRDKAATAFFTNDKDLEGSCDSMKCKTPSRDGYFISGPALPGTVCGKSKWCVGGQCVPTGRNVVQKSETGGWSDWKDGPCSSGCLTRSKGAVTSQRDCDKPKPSDVLHRCEGPSVRASLCDDTQVCTDKMTRQSAVDYARQQCIKFSAVVHAIDAEATGLQADYSAKRPWQSCAIYCKKKDGNGFYTPRLELNSVIDTSAYFPDGTWCGNDGQKDLYCLQRTCVSGDQNTARTLAGSSDFEVLNNAPLTPNAADHSPPVSVQEYFSLDKDGKPIKEEIDSEALHSFGKSGNSQTGYVDDDFIKIKPH